MNSGRNILGLNKKRSKSVLSRKRGKKAIDGASVDLKQGNWKKRNKERIEADGKRKRE